MSLVGVRDIIGTTKEKPQFSAAFAEVTIRSDFRQLATRKRHRREYGVCQSGL